VPVVVDFPRLRVEDPLDWPSPVMWVPQDTHLEVIEECRVEEPPAAGNCPPLDRSAAAP
jgi:hypothetical protein